MEEIKKRKENIKFWKRRMVVSALLLSNLLVVKIFPGTIDWFIDTLFGWNKDIGIFFAFLYFGIGSLAGGWFLIMGRCSLEQLKIRCEKCGRVIPFEDTETMGDKFRCPYCLNDTIKMNYPQTEAEVNRQTERILGRIVRNIFRNMK